MTSMSQAARQFTNCNEYLLGQRWDATGNERMRQPASCQSGLPSSLRLCLHPCEAHRRFMLLMAHACVVCCFAYLPIEIPNSRSIAE